MNGKHGFALLWSMLLCLACLCACGEDSSAEPEGNVGEEPPVVFLPEEAPQEAPPEPTDAVYSVSMGDYIVEYAIPAAWDSRYTTQTYAGETGCYEVGFYHTASAEFGGWLFSLRLMEGEDWRDFPETTALAADGDFTLVCMRPSDVQFDVSSAEEYLALSREIDGIVAQVKFQKP